MIDTSRFADELRELTQRWEIEGALFVMHRGNVIFEEIRMEDWEGNAEDLRFFLHYDCDILLYETALIHRMSWNDGIREDLAARFGSVENAIAKAAEKVGARTMAENREQQAFETGIGDLFTFIRSTRARTPKGWEEKTDGWVMLQDQWGDCSVAVYLDEMNETAMIHFSAQPETILLNEQHLLTYFRLELRQTVDAYLLDAARAQLAEFSQENLEGAVRLELEEEQYAFILDTRSCICRAYALRDAASTYVLQCDGRAVGLAVLLRGREAEIDAFLIDRRYQGRGFGERMLKLLLANLKEEKSVCVTAGCAEENEAAISLYRKFGFQEEPSEEEGVLMRKML